MSQSIGTLWTVPYQLEGKRIRALAALSGLELDIGEGYTHFETNRTPGFEAKFPSGKIPSFEGKDGLKLFESIAISRYIASLVPKAGLLGKTPKEAALIDQWVAFATNDIGSHSSTVLLLTRGYLKPYVKALDTESRNRLLRGLGTIEKHLSTRTFFVGERITLADITVASVLIRAFQLIFDPETRKSHPNVVRFFETIINQPKLKDIFGEVEYIDKQAQYVPPKKE
ncbi:glutathione S-transferase C-terminal-like protein [Sistotremastrum niveocremeum HHB9708]|uniref:Glutathione S-transferase C-terminal-like protein n=1 Tax=Sistotremastrum niveocremeum HHB9708 TaxID=1314777 RepID=A0A164P1K5_9AGAM|nr:glutathione S-transferase C-terminal-like protein [Sistotremastrum niveocremeum HHB9708]